MTSQQWLPKKAIAAHFSLTTRTVERWIYDGCPSRLIGGVRRLRLSDVDAFLTEREAS